MKKIILTAFILTSLAVANGTSGAEMLAVDLSVAGGAMGRAAVMQSSGLDHMNINPASLSEVNTLQYGLGIYPWYAKNNVINILSAIRLKKAGTVGLGWAGTIYGDVNGTDSGGADLGALKSSDHQLSLSYGREIVPFLSAGLNMKLYAGKLDDDAKAVSLAFDIGMQGKWLDNSLKAGLALKNFGTKAAYGNSPAYKLPTDVRLGVSYRIPLTEIAGLEPALEFQIPFASDVRMAIGAELSFDFLYVRLGDYYFINKVKGSINSFTAGFGVDMGRMPFLEGKKPGFKVDFAFNTGSVLGPVFQIGLTGSLDIGMGIDKPEQVGKARDDDKEPEEEKKETVSDVKSPDPVKEIPKPVEVKPEPEKPVEKVELTPAQRDAALKKIEVLKIQGNKALKSGDFDLYDKILLEIEELERQLK